jgi:hypothetical protein
VTGHFTPICGSSPRADDGYGPGILLCERAFDVQHGWRSRDLEEKSGIDRVFPGERLRASGSDPFHLAVQIELGPVRQQILQRATIQAGLPQLLRWCVPGAFDVPKVVK